MTKPHFTIWQDASKLWAWGLRPPYGDAVFTGYETHDAAATAAQQHFAMASVAVDQYLKARG